MRNPLVGRLGSLALLSAFVLGGCSNSDNGGTGPGTPPTPEVMQARGAEIGAAAVEGIDETLGSMLQEESGTGFMASVVNPMAVNPTPCPTINFTFTNSPVPTWTLSLQFGDTPEVLSPWPPAADDPCLRGSTERGQAYFFGLLEASRTGTRNSDLERTEKATTLGAIFSKNNFVDFLRLERDGERNFNRTGAGVSITEDMTTTRQKARGPDTLGSVINSQLEFTFTPKEGEELVANHRRPSGTIVINRLWTFEGQVKVRGTDPVTNEPVTTIEDVSITKQVETLTPLEYDATCDAPPSRRIVAGQLRLTHIRGDQTSVITITWTGCGQRPTIDPPPPEGDDEDHADNGDGGDGDHDGDRGGDHDDVRTVRVSN